MVDKVQNTNKSLSGQDNLQYKSLGKESLTDNPQQPNTINTEPQVKLQDKPSINTKTD